MMESYKRCDDLGDGNTLSDSDKEKVINTIFRACDVNQSGKTSVKCIEEYVIMEAKKYNMMAHLDFNQLHDLLTEYSKDGIISEAMCNKAINIWLDNMFLNRNNLQAINNWFVPEYSVTSLPMVQNDHTDGEIANDFLLKEGRLSLVSSTPIFNRFLSKGHLSNSPESNVADVSSCLIKNINILDSSTSMCRTCHQYEQHIGELRELMRQGEDYNETLQNEINSLQTKVQMMELKIDQFRRLEKTNKELLESNESKDALYLSATTMIKELEIRNEKLRQLHVKLQRQVHNLEGKLLLTEESKQNLQTLLRGNKKEGAKLRNMNHNYCEEIANLKETVEILRIDVQTAKFEKKELESTLSMLQREASLKRETSVVFSSLPTYLGDEADISHFAISSQMYFAAQTAPVCKHNSLQAELEACELSSVNGAVQQLTGENTCTNTSTEERDHNIFNDRDFQPPLQSPSFYNTALELDNSTWKVRQLIRQVTSRSPATGEKYQDSSNDQITLQSPYTKSLEVQTSPGNAKEISMQVMRKDIVTESQDKVGFTGQNTQKKKWSKGAKLGTQKQSLKKWKWQLHAEETSTLNDEHQSTQHLSSSLQILSNTMDIARVPCRLLVWLLVLLLVVVLVVIRYCMLMPVGVQPRSTIPWSWMTWEEFLGPFITLRYIRPPPT